MNKQFFTFLSLVLLFFCLVCNRSPSQPEEKINNPRNYTWTVDTLAYPGSFQTLTTSIWGSSAKDVYVVGHNAAGPGKMYRYTGDGMWHHINLPKIGHWFDLSAVYGFAENDVWTAGYSRELITRDSTGRGVYENRSLIFHYDGVQWSEVDLPEGGNMLQSLWGSAPDDIWAGGMNTLLHYTGGMWRNVPIFIPSQGVQLSSISGLSTDEVYFTAYRNDVVDPIDTTFHYLYKYDGNECRIIDSTYVTVNHYDRKFGSNLRVIDGTLYSGQNGIFMMENNTWEKILDDHLLFFINGSAWDNIFCVGGYRTVYHYNGTDWQQLTISDAFSDIMLYGVYTDRKEAFITSHDGFKTYIFHGK